MSTASSSSWGYGILCFIAGAAAVFILVEHRRLATDLAVLRVERDRLAAEQKQTQARLERVEATVSELENRRPRVESRFTPLERRVEEPMPGPMPGQPRQITVRPRVDHIVSRPATVEFSPSSRGAGRRGWGPEQAEGPPDTPTAGDHVTAWASREPDAGPEWLRLEFEKAVEIAEVRIRETYNPGAVIKVTAEVNGAEQVLWQGTSPTAEAPQEFAVPVTGRVPAARVIVVHLDTSRVPGWNEIDAVELVGKDGSRQWARSAKASSTYAERLLPAETFEPIQPIPAPGG